jgi:hypothetical protein
MSGCVDPFGNSLIHQFVVYLEGIDVSRRESSPTNPENLFLPRNKTSHTVTTSEGGCHEVTYRMVDFLNNNWAVGLNSDPE